ncbi:MerR family transcriptional regulator [Nocardia nova]|uniref:MerR family transcriptional regulator n=1 Tax=Nocardia nova TaxID=37330 RepID=UPI000CEA172B|nr:MerR family transcriptional regulator [Nocardia nova]PPJ00690.1 MerR family transcriptional regulator [Nocardia nova]
MLIGEVARYSGVSARMLRHYDSLGLVRPTGRTVGGYREYSVEDIRRIFHVEGLRSLGLSLTQIGRALDDPGFTPSALVGDLVRATEERLSRDRELLERLRAVEAAEPSGWQDALRIVELLRGLGSSDAARRQQAVLAPAEEMPAELLAEAVLTESDPYVAGALRWALARAGAEGVLHVASGLDSADVEVRRRAASALAEIPGEEAGAVLLDALTGADPTVRRISALALGARGETRAVPELVATVIEGPNDVEAAELLGSLARDAKWADHILNALAGELAAHPPGSPVRLRLAQALAELPGSLALNTLRPLMNDDDRTVALLAAALVRTLEQEPPAPRGGDRGSTELA